ncbi:unnamed protein product, partial [Didymodactylos carnosus]
ASLDDVATYNRRTNLRIYGVKEERKENTDQIVIGICASIGITISDEHISVSHRIGRKKNDKTSRAIIVRFVHYRTRQLILIHKKQLNKSIWINEDLTWTNLSIFKYARSKLEKKQVYTWYGLIMYNDGNKRICLTSTDYVDLLIDGEEEEK